MRKVRSRTQDMLESIGMSDNILTLIERRSKTDLLIFFGLAIGLLIFMYFLYFYAKPSMIALFTGSDDGEGLCVADPNDPSVKTEC